MAEMQLTEEQRRQIESLVSAIGRDAGLRERFQTDPRTVLGEYGLAGLVPPDLQLEVAVDQLEVAGFAGSGTGHWDIRHADSAPTPGNPPTPHIDFPHTDIAALAFGGARFTITPGFRTLR